jgi:predicted alpha-1,2-mannosidase
MKIAIIGLLFISLLSSSCQNRHTSKVISLEDNLIYVNVFIGTGGHGHTYPGVTVPHGMVQLSPDTRTLGWDACGGYHYSDSSIIGFSHTHLSGTGIGDLGDILFMPVTGLPKVVPGTPENPDSGYRSRFSHSDEMAGPGYYSVLLRDYDIFAELTASTRAGFHRYTYNNNEQQSLVIDLAHKIYPDRNPSHEFRIINDREIAGYKGSGGWATVQHTWFHAKFNKPFTVAFYDNGQEVSATQSLASNHLVAVLTFEADNDKELLAKVGISHVDYEGARKNLDTEIPHWDFNLVKESARQLWSKELNQIQVQGGTLEEKIIFYSALYHTAIVPYTFSDADGRYRGMDQSIHQIEGRRMYTVFSLWDTFRALHPLKTILNPDLNNDFIYALLSKYDQGGILPKWELQANYTGTMIGSHAIPVIVDAYMKGLIDFDVEKVYDAMKKSVSYDTTGILFPSRAVKEKLVPKALYYNETLGYIPADLEVEAVSQALEYAYNDWCVAQMAKELGKMDDYEYYLERSRRYAQYYDEETGFMRGLLSDGTWRYPFDPRFSRHRRDDYCEGNAFQWSWFVPHDVEGLMELFGGKDIFIQKLDTLFSTSSELIGEEVSSDISGMIGQYAHGNEPSHHITHMYNFAGQPWKTQELVDQVMRELYFNDPNGLSGNEDCGQMSAWYVLNALGFYSFLPGHPTYSIGRPLFDRSDIHLTNGKVFSIIAKNNSPENKYVQSVKLNGTNLTSAFFNHNDIVDGGTLEFEMGPIINKQLFK